MVICPNCNRECNYESNFCTYCRYEFRKDGISLETHNDLKNVLIGMSTGVLTGITVGTLTLFARAGIETAIIAFISYLITIGIIIGVLSQLRKPIQR